MKIYFVILLFVIIQNSSAQKQMPKVIFQEVPIGKNYISGQEIKAIRYKFNYWIYKQYIDSKNNTVSLQLRAVNDNHYDLDGFISLFDLTKNEFVYSKIIPDFSMIQSDSIIIERRAYNSIRLNYINGEKIWKVPLNIYFIFPKANIGVGYPAKTYSTKENLKGIDLKNGLERWERIIDASYGWEKVLFLSDTTVLISASGLHSINLNTGKGWDYDAVTGSKDYAGTVAANVIGTGLALLTGFGFISTGASATTHGICSNVSFYKDNYYYASMEKLVCINQDGRVLWESKLDDRKTSASVVFCRNDNVYLINTGRGKVNNKAAKIGNASFSMYNAESGFLVNKTELDTKAIIEEVKRIDNNIFLLTQKSIMKFDLSNVNLTAEKKFSTEPNNFMGSKIHSQKEDSTYSNARYKDTTAIHVFFKNSIIRSFDQDLNVTDEFKYEKSYYSYLYYKQHTFLIKDNNTIIINSSGKKIASLRLSSDVEIIGDKLYAMDKDRLTVMDLNSIPFSVKE